MYQKYQFYNKNIILKCLNLYKIKQIQKILDRKQDITTYLKATKKFTKIKKTPT